MMRRSFPESGHRILSVALAALLLAAAAAPEPATLVFPRDHGAHPETAVEWWYYTGHLTGEGRLAYGFQLTFFRVRDLYLAHFAWTDVARGEFRYAEKVHLGLPGIAGASARGLDVFNEDWSAREGEGGLVRLRAESPEIGELMLTLRPAKPPVLNGPGGISRKGPGPEEFSHYVSITRLSASGSLGRDGRRQDLSGTAWFDHEWGPGVLPAGAAGWDWFALQLSDGSDLMLYRIRLADGRASDFSSGIWVPRDGPARPILWKDVALGEHSIWTSPRTRARYPAAWSLSVRSIGLEATITPFVSDQELSTEKSTGVTYWEGACRVAGKLGGRPIDGRAYVELTGYAGRDVPGFAAPPPPSAGPESGQAPRASRPSGASARPPSSR
jgi:predicted secreted hydrolase